MSDGNHSLSNSNLRNFSRWLHWLIFVLILLIAFFFRFYRLADHPLGTFFDPAINGLDAVRLIERGGYTPFFPTNGGREALFVYLLTPFIRLFGTTPFALRLLPSLISLLTVALLIGFLYTARFTLHLSSALCRERLHFWIATLAGLTLAVSPWHITLSRLPFRAILLPALAIPLIWFFLKGWHTGHKRWFILAGLCLGLAGYTYSAARLLPLILILALLPEFLILTPKKRPAAIHHTPISNLQSPISNLSIFLLTAAIIYLPMAWYFLTHPSQFAARATSVMVWNFLDTPAEIIAELGRNSLRVAGFFCCVGSPNPIFGLPGYPGVSLFLAPFLLTGLIVALRRWRDLFHRLIALWWLIGLIPSLIAIEAPHPLRLTVALIPTAILVALGILHLAQWVSSNVPAASPTRPYVLRFTLYAAALLILLPTPSLFRAYFIDWTRLQTTQGAYNYSAVAMRSAILALPTEASPVYLPLIRFNDTPLLFYLSGPFQRRADLAPTPDDQAWVVAPVGQARSAVWIRLYQGEMTLIPPLTGEGQDLIQTALAGSQVRPVQTLSGEMVAHLTRLPADPARFLQQPSHTAAAQFGPARLIGLNYDPVIEQSISTLPVTLFWEAVEPMRDEYEVILQLVDDNRRSWGDGSGRPTDWVYPTSFWRPGLDQIAARQTITLDAGALPPGRYWLAVALFDPTTQQRLPLTDAPSDSPDTLFIGPLKAPLPPPPLNDPLPIPDAETAFGQVIRLAGVDVPSSPLTAGETLTVDLLWEALDQPDQDYTVFIHLLDANGDIVAGQDTQPLAGRYPTSIWSPGEQLLDPHRLPLPTDLPPGDYRLALGLYHQPSGHRLPLTVAEEPVEAGQFILPQPLIINEK